MSGEPSIEPARSTLSYDNSTPSPTPPAMLRQSTQLSVAELCAAGDSVARSVYGSKSNSPDYIIKGVARYRILIQKRRLEDELRKLLGDEYDNKAGRCP